MQITVLTMKRILIVMAAFMLLSMKWLPYSVMSRVVDRIGKYCQLRFLFGIRYLDRSLYQTDTI